jgi:hypothetical protein
MSPRGYDKTGKPLGGHSTVGRKPKPDPKKSLAIPVKQSLCEVYKNLTKDQKQAVAKATERAIKRNSQP